MVGHMLSKILNKRLNKRKTVLSAEDKEFIQKNRDFWSSFPSKENGGKILIEKPSISGITHTNAVFTVILNQAKSYTPVWLYSDEWPIEIFKSYVPTAKYIKNQIILFDIFRIILVSIWKFLIIYKTRDILSFSYDGVKYGDIVYDTYLTHEKVGTIKNINLKLLYIILVCIRRHEQFRRILDEEDIDGVLVAHQVNIHSGVLLRTAVRYGYKGYLRSGAQKNSLHCFEKLEDIYYPYKTFPEDVDDILSKLEPNLTATYKSVFNENLSGKTNRDARNAFSKDNLIYPDREAFNREYGLDINKKNIFVMLHVLNDSPHSHYNWMLFNDYYDWFVKTLVFARENNTVNWIFKQHPSIKDYITLDVSFDSLFLEIPKNIVYIDENEQIDTRILKYCADVIITCSGSAGFELPAMAGIPSITAGDNFYTGLGFAIEPKTKKDYFSILKNVNNIKPLTQEQQKRAQAVYLNIYHFIDVNMSTYPTSFLEEQNVRNANAWNLKNTYQTYHQKEDIIKKELKTYIAEIAKPDFKRLVGDNEWKMMR